MTEPTTFEALGLPDFVLKSLKQLGYETPSPIQAQTIEPMMSGADVLGQAQTGTGKTAAFALPLVAKLSTRKKKPQAIVLAPTRELAIQVAEAFQAYAKDRSGFHVLPIYGGQSYTNQIRSLKRGVQVVVGTPGRVMDHMRKGTLDLSELETIVLDEADEMLRMGFIDDVEWILEQTPDSRQVALFSATMPREIERIANRYLTDPVHVRIEQKVKTATTIRQRMMMVPGHQKLDVFTRILEVEDFDAMIVFVRTKLATEEVAQKLQARGYAAQALNGDMPQQARERSVDALKRGKIDVVVATDVAARGLDVERITHVINYDIPYDTEAYVHRIGRTGRAGRSGDAILFVTNRERRMLRDIEKATNSTIEQMQLPSAEDVNTIRVQRFKDQIAQAATDQTDKNFNRELVESFAEDSGLDMVEIATALVKMAQGDRPLKVEEIKIPKERAERGERGDRRERGERRDLSTFEDYRIDLGSKAGVQPKHIVGAIANEVGIPSKDIGPISVRGEYSLVALPIGMPGPVFKKLQALHVLGKPMNIRQHTSKGKGGFKGKEGGRDGGKGGKKFKKKGKKSNSDRGRSKD